IWWLLPESKTWQAVRVTGSALRLLMERPWRRRVAILATMTGLLAVLLEPAGLLYTVYASFILHWSTLVISILIVVSGIAGAVAAAVGSIAGLQAVGVLAATTGLGGAIQLGGVVALAGALLLFLLPETKQQPLPE